MTKGTWSPHIEAGAATLFELLRNGPRAEMPWDEVPPEQQNRMCAAFEEALTSFIESAKGL